MEFIDLKSQQNQLLDDEKSLREEINRRIKLVLDHGKFILGPEVKELEKKLAEYVGVKHCISVSSGTDALLVALMSLEISPGDEVITTPFSFFSTVETILLLGAKPIFVDIEKNTYNIDPSKIENAITKKTRAIIPVSLYGQPANFTAINSIASSYKISVIEDGAQSFGSNHKNKRSCGLSTIGTTSFFPSKPLGCYGDGGACFTDDDHLATSMREISLHGQNRRYRHHRIGINGRLDTIQAAVLLAKLPLFEKEVYLREKIAKSYTQKLNKKEFFNTPYIEKFNSSVYAQYTIQVDHREAIIDSLKAKGIPTAVHYPILLPDQEALNKKKKGFVNSLINRKMYKSLNIENARSLCSRVLSLPFHPNLKNQDQDLIISSLLDSINSQ